MNRLQKFFKRLQKKKKATQVKNIAIRPFEYHPKIILAWAKGIEGNADLLKYLNENGFEELVQAARAIHGKERARSWLLENGYPQVTAFIRAYEKDPQALNWLMSHKFELFYFMALAVRDEDEGFVWINKNSTQEFFLLTKVIKHIKEERDEEQYYRVNKKRMGLNDED